MAWQRCILNDDAPGFDEKYSLTNGYDHNIEFLRENPHDLDERIYELMERSNGFGAD